jgi:uncharacterized protein YbjT (DUF2867 family)
MKVLVTGASGYIGRQLAEKLSAAGHDVTCMVRNAGQAPQLLQISSDCFRLAPWTFPGIRSMIAPTCGIYSPAPQGAR